MPEPAVRNGREPPTSLTTGAARQLTTVTKSVPTMREISARWLLRVLPWVNAPGGVYRVNRRLVHRAGVGRVAFTSVGSAPRLVPRSLGDVLPFWYFPAGAMLQAARVIPASLREVGLFRHLDDGDALEAFAERFEEVELSTGEDAPDGQIVLVVHGKLERTGPGKYGQTSVVDVLSDGDHFGPSDEPSWTVRALTPTKVLVLSTEAFAEVVDRTPGLREELAVRAAAPRPPQNRLGEAAIDIASGHAGEPSLPETFVDYDPTPREYELSVSQTVLRVHTRVEDLYSQPMDQFQQQLRLTVEALREHEEHELINNPGFGLLHNADRRQRVNTHSGPPTPDDMDDLLARRRSTHYYLAHPRAIAAFGRECNKRGLSPEAVQVDGTRTAAWRGVPILPCNKIPIEPEGTTSILAFRTGEENEGVIGLHQTGLPDEHEPGLNVRKMDVDDKAVADYLVSTYYSAAILVPDALGVLENVEIGR